MAYPLPARIGMIEVPRPRGVVVRARITGPLALESDSYLGGFAAGARFVYSDKMQFVWWSPTGLPVLPDGGAFSAAFDAAFYGGG